MERLELIALLNDFRQLSGETEWLEFKTATNDFAFDKLGEQFSALSNEANLHQKEYGWLIFGVRDSDRAIVCTNFKKDRMGLEKLKTDLTQHTNSRIGFVDIHELLLPQRILMFQVPAALPGNPTEWKGHCYGREGDGTFALSREKRSRIDRQSSEVDWSSGLCTNATIADLDPNALAKARDNYKIKFPTRAIEVESWSDEVFLNKAKVTIKGNITRAAILLLGKEEAEHFVTPADAKIRWVLKDSKGVEQDWYVESCPFLLAVDRIYSRIRNLRYRYIKEGTLFPDEVDRYEPFTIREALNNCIAHQDYTLGGRINVVEGEDHLIFTNLGSFIPGSVEKVIKDDAPEEKYRNKFLASAMANLNMVDTIGGGIRRMFIHQRERFFPLPDYDVSNNRVKVTVVGKVLDMDFASVLARDQSLTLEEIMMLDKVQKKKPLTKIEAVHLRRKSLIEGIKPNYFISARLAQKTGQKVTYTKAKAFEKEKYFDYIFNFLRQHGHAGRPDIDELLWNVLPDWMSDQQKKTRINHILTELSSKGLIVNTGSRRPSRWVLSNSLPS